LSADSEVKRITWVVDYKRTRTNLEKTHIYFFVVSILMYKQLSFVITAAIMLTAFVTVALYTGSQTAHAAFIVIEKPQHPGLAKLAIAAAARNMTNATAAGGNMTNATAAGGNMTK
jgi:hypothetical protein